jgi:hypothetical protein
MLESLLVSVQTLCYSQAAMTKTAIVIGLSIMLALGSGCQYATARLRDAVDCVAASVTAGPGFLLDAQATWLARVGGGYLEGERYAIYYGRPSHFPDTRSSLMALAPLFSIEDTQNQPGGPSPWITTVLFMPLAMGPDGGSHANLLRSPVYGLPWTLRGNPVELLEQRTACGNGYMDVGLNVHLFLLGVEFRIKLSEVIDFLVGFATLDISGDDARACSGKPAPEKADWLEKHVGE